MLRHTECAYYILNCKEAIIMTVFSISGRFFPTLLVVLTIVLSTTKAAAEEAATAEGDGALLIAKAPAKPQPTKYDLRYKLKRGDVLRYGVIHRASIRSTIDDTTQSAQTKTDSIKLWKVTDVLPSGEIEFMNVVERVHMVNQLPDRDPAEYDSERDTTPPPGFEDAAKAVGVPLSQVRITPRGKVVRRDIKHRGQSLDENAPVAVRLPEEPVAIGATWDEALEVKVTLEDGGSKSIQTRRHHKLAEVANGIATIDVTYQVLSPVNAHIECQLVQRLMQGEVRFDIEEGKVVGQQMDIDKRILGFAGPTSSMQYVMRMDETLLKGAAAMTRKPSATRTARERPSTRAASRPSSNRSRNGTRTNRR